MRALAATGTVLAVHRLHPSAGLNVFADTAVAIAFGFGVLAAVYATPELSGAHLNPAITLGLAVAGEFPAVLVPLSLAAQLGGAVLAGLMDWFVFANAATAPAVLIGATKPGPGVTWSSALFTEFVITAVSPSSSWRRASTRRRRAGASRLGSRAGSGRARRSSSRCRSPARR